MSNNYSVGTGLLIFAGPAIISPIIRTLFEAAGLRAIGESEPNLAYVAEDSDEHDLSIDGLATTFANNANELGIELPVEADASDVREWLWAAMEKLHVNDVDLSDFIDRLSSSDDASLDVRFFLAKRFRDGHNLSAIQYENAWWSDKARLGEFGGSGCYISQSVEMRSNSYGAADVGQKLEAAAQTGNVEALLQIISDGARERLTSLTDETLRNTVASALPGRIAEMSRSWS